MAALCYSKHGTKEEEGQRELVTHGTKEEEGQRELVTLGFCRREVILILITPVAGSKNVQD